MAETDATTMDAPSGPLANMAELPVVRQIGILVGLAASIALGFWVVLWAQQPDYQVLFNQVDDQEISEVASVLDSAQIPYKLNMGSGAILVDSGELSRARLLLASKGLPRSSATGFDILEKDDGFGISQFREKARYHRALEGELAQSISSIRSVRSARVHLALPKQSVFVRKRTKPTASVVVDLYAGRVLEMGQVAAVVHMVASSIPNLESSQVTVIDQAGRLLTTQDSGSEMALSVRQLEYIRNLENNYVERIQNILVPIMGIGKVRAQVSAKVDFTTFEETTEDYTPEEGAVRSEQLRDERSGQLSSEGVPGALSNNAEALNASKEQSGEGYQNSHKTRNYELDRTVRHTKKAPGALQNISIAVVVDEPMVAAAAPAEGEAAAAPTRRALTEEEMAQIRSLVVEAVGFDQERGDTLTVTSAPFHVEKVEALPEIPFIEQPWVMPLAKQVLAGIVVLLLIFMVLKPMISNLSTPAVALQSAGGEGVVMAGGAVAGAEDAIADAAMTQAERDEILEGEVPPGYEERLNAAKSQVSNDDKVATMVIRNWSDEAEE